MIRGLAAIAVLIFHVRYRFFLDYADLVDPTVWQKFFYMITAFGHDAVMVFFVLSGYFISRSVIRDHRSARWSWKGYLVNRLVRLCVVLLPGLLLTLFWDRLGLGLFPNHPVYTGVGQDWIHDFFSVRLRLDLPTFLGNVGFLQGVLVAPFGSNEPLWSLAYEFWYYILFPCLWLALVGGQIKIWKRVAYAGAAGFLLAFLGSRIALYFPIWLLGTAVVFIPASKRIRERSRYLVPLAIAFFGMLVVSTHAAPVKQLLGGSVLKIDYVTGLGTAWLLYILLHASEPRILGTPYRAAAKVFAGLSYTLYVVHMPLLIFLRAAIVPGRPWTPDPYEVGLATLLAAALFVYAWTVASLTENKTSQVRSWVLRQLRVASSNRST